MNQHKSALICFSRSQVNDETYKVIRQKRYFVGHDPNLAALRTAVFQRGQCV